MNWKEYYQKESVKALTSIFESDFTPNEIIQQYNELYERIKTYAGRLKVKGIEKMTYEMLIGERPNLPEHIKDFRDNYIYIQLEDLAVKYNEVSEYLIDYLDRKITLKQLNKRIRDFKKTNFEYLSRYGKT